MDSPIQPPAANPLELSPEIHPLLDPRLASRTNLLHWILTIFGGCYILLAILTALLLVGNFVYALQLIGGLFVVELPGPSWGAVAAFSGALFFFLGPAAWVALCLLFLKRNHLRWQRACWLLSSIAGFASLPFHGWAFFRMLRIPDNPSVVVMDSSGALPHYGSNLEMMVTLPSGVFLTLNIFFALALLLSFVCTIVGIIYARQAKKISQDRIRMLGQACVV